MKPRPKRRLTLGAALAGAGTAVLLWELAPSPMIWELALGVIAGGVATRLTDGRLRTLAFNGALFALLLLPVEIYLAYQDRTNAPTVQPPALTLDDPLPPGITTALPSDPKWVLTENRTGLTVYQAGGRLVKHHNRLGWIHRESARVGERMYRGEKLLYEVVYNIGPDGLRLTDSGLEVPDEAPVVPFLGCSFTFGQGLEDRQTLPSAFEAAAGGRYRALNWGISGAGPHSILAQLELERDVELLAGRAVPFVVMVAIRHHLQRIAGETHFSSFYPRYALRDGRLVADGQFPPPKARSELSFGEAVSFEARKSHLIGHLVERLPSAVGWVDDDGVALFLAITERIRDLLAERHHSELVVITWDDFGPEQEPIAVGLRAAGIRFYDAATLFPDFTPETHYLPHYSHPNAHANRVLAEFLAQRLHGPEDEQPAGQTAPQP